MTKKLLFGSLLIVLLVLVGGLFPAVKAGAQKAQVPASTTSSAISLSRLKDVLRQGLGQQAVDHMRQRVTQPLAIQAPTQPATTLMPAAAATHAHVQPADTPEYLLTSSTLAGYATYAQGVSWTQAVAGFSPCQPQRPRLSFRHSSIFQILIQTKA